MTLWPFIWNPNYIFHICLATVVWRTWSDVRSLMFSYPHSAQTLWLRGLPGYMCGTHLQTQTLNASQELDMMWPLSIAADLLRCPNWKLQQIYDMQCLTTSNWIMDIALMWYVPSPLYRQMAKHPWIRFLVKLYMHFTDIYCLTRPPT